MFIGYRMNRMSFIKLNDVCLDYIIKTGSISFKKIAIDSLKSFITKKTSTALYHSSFRALKNINLSIEKGDRIGLIGRNGAGKSTLLRVLAKVYKPNVGTIDVKGNISSLFDINLGLNSEASGYDNIVLLGIMRGFSKRKAENLIPDVESFTELGSFLKAPVRTYSTGMQMKLVFAVATAENPDILLIDEIIGAGDAHFMEKATIRLRNLIDRSHILVLTSHSNDIIRRFCNKAIVLDKGEIQFIGDVNEGTRFYESSFG